jgi:hypothetical protein
LKVTLPNPFRSGARGWGTLGQQNHAAGGENGSIMVGIFVSRVLANQKPFERELFVPARTDLGLGVKLFIKSDIEKTLNMLRLRVFWATQVCTIPLGPCVLSPSACCRSWLCFL